MECVIKRTLTQGGRRIRQQAETRQCLMHRRPHTASAAFPINFSIRTFVRTAHSPSPAHEVGEDFDSIPRFQPARGSEGQRTRRRAFVEGSVLYGDRFMSFSVSEWHHIVNVLRLSPGDTIWVAGTNPSSSRKKNTSSQEDFEGKWVKAQLERGQKKGTWGCRISAPTEDLAETEPGTEVIPVILEVGMPKMSRFEWIIEKATELGVLEVRPIVSEYATSIAATGAKRGGGSRWKERSEIIATQALKQCGRTRRLKIANAIEVGALERGVTRLVALEPSHWAFAAKRSGNSENHFDDVTTAGPRSIIKALNEILLNNPAAISREGQGITLSHPIHLCIGPEGGWSEREVVALLNPPPARQRDKGQEGEVDAMEAEATTEGTVVPVALGTGVLRTETACVAGLGCVAAALMK
ncbi:hypothetical protein HDU67_002950 [Dinochytrium kinnereticum]|nr:hypothetical protein HDU67_002950 [Dinochytrium kinnereticum]